MRPECIFRHMFFKEECKKKHTMATDDQVPKILEVLAPFLKEPSKIKAGQ